MRKYQNSPYTHFFFKNLFLPWLWRKFVSVLEHKVISKARLGCSIFSNPSYLCMWNSVSGDKAQLNLSPSTKRNQVAELYFDSDTVLNLAWVGSTAALNLARRRVYTSTDRLSINRGSLIIPQNAYGRSFPARSSRCKSIQYYRSWPLQLYWRFLMTRKTRTRGHVAFDTSGLFWKIALRLDSPYLQQIASIRKMPKNAITCRTSIRRFKSGLVVSTLYWISYRIEFFGRKKVPGPGSVH
jgi:hypothetical protein